MALALREAAGRYDPTVLVMAPPRSGSTAFARVFWEHPDIRYYAHEPFEAVYHHGAPAATAAGHLAAPLDLHALRVTRGGTRGGGLVIKEMPFQVGPHFPDLRALATGPVVFLLRDPRLNIASRMARKRQVGVDPLFPLVETGWTALASHVGWCREHGADYVIVDATDFRNAPADVVPRVYAALGLPYTPDVLTWRAASHLDIDNLEGAHRHLYRKVLRSTGVLPATETIPPVASFPTAGGFRDHVRECLDIYARLCDDDRRIVPSALDQTT